MKRSPRLRKNPRTTRAARRRTLSRDAILRAALEIADREGLARLTIRKLALAMKVTPMAVYRYFANKTEITDGIVDLVAAAANRRKARDEDWRRWLRTTLSVERKLLRAHPGVMPLLGTPAGFGPNTLVAMNDILSVLLDAGLTAPMAAQAYYVLTSYNVGAAAIVNAARAAEPNATPIKAGRWFTQAFTRCGDDAASRMPTLARVAPYLADFASEAHYLYGLDQLLDALDAEIKRKRRPV